MTRPTTAFIDVGALRHNLNQVRTYAPNSRVLAMVKSNAYGHMIQIATQGLIDSDAFGVACLEEALQLRAIGVKQPIFLMEGFFSVDELSAILEHGLTIVVHEAWQVEALTQFQTQYKFNLWLKIDTGMHRLGFSPESATAMWQKLNCCEKINKPIGLMTHFSQSDSSHPTLKQVQCFNEIVADWPGPRSVANSAAIIKSSDTHAEWVRPGIMLYGVSPLNDYAAQYNLQSAMTLTSAIIAKHSCYRGDKIGYGGIYECEEDMPVGVIAIGYGDGYPRSAPNGTPVMVNNTLVPLIGRVAMDMITVDLRKCPTAKIGDQVVLWGRGLPIETIARHANTIAYELLCRITQRVHYISM